MSTDVQPAGWHPDPTNHGLMRWWDGSRWTEHTQQLPPAPGVGQQASQTVAAGPSVNRFGSDCAPVGGVGARVQFASPAPSASFVSRNSKSLIAIAVVAAYVFIALNTRVVVFGVVPVLLAVRAFKRGEQLAPVAAIAAGVAVLIAVLALSH